MTEFPKAALGQHIAVLGKTGSGKSYAVRGIVEQLLEEQARVCVIDPTGAWYGLRSSASGKGAGFPVVIFGGSHADLPLGATHGEAIAEIIGTSSTPAIIDTSLMRVGERTRFFADFADALVRKNKGPLHLVIDEAHLFAPQGKVNDPQSGAMLHAANNLVSLGRSRGLRIVLITQRPAKLHKDALTQVETLVAMRLIAPQDRKAVEEWIADNADPAKGREIIKSLALLKTGEGIIWAPGLGILSLIHFPKIKTFDTGRAPDGSEAAAKVLAPIDRDAISARLASVSAEAVANDPAALKRRIADLERQVKAAPPAGASDAQLEAAARQGMAMGYRDAVVALSEEIRAALMAGGEMMTKLRATGQAIHAAGATPHTPPGVRMPTNSPAFGKPAGPAQRTRQAPVSLGNGDGEVGSGGKRRILTALAQFPGDMTTRKLSILVDIAPKGGTWRTYMAELRGKGWIGGGRDALRITPAGLQALGSYEPLPTGEALIQYWRTRLGESGKRAIFDTVVEAYPGSIDVDTVSVRTGIAREGGTWRTYLAELRGLGIIEGRGELQAAADLFA